MWAQQRSEKQKRMARHGRWQLVVLSACWFFAATVAAAATEVDPTNPQLLPGDRVLLGTVLDVKSEQARIDTGELQPRFIPMGVRGAKGLPDLKRGDRVEITVNDQNLLVDVHLVGETSHHHVVEGQLAQPLVTGHDRAVLRTTRGEEESHFIRPVARSKVASVPVGVDAAFLIDESDRIVDVTFGSTEAVHRAAKLWKQKTPLKGNFERIIGTVVTPLENNRIAIRTKKGEMQPYEVRPLAQQMLAKLSAGDAVVLLVDDEHKVIDIAIPPGPSGSDQR